MFHIGGTLTGITGLAAFSATIETFATTLLSAAEVEAVCAVVVAVDEVEDGDCFLFEPFDFEGLVVELDVSLSDDDGTGAAVVDWDSFFLDLL